MLEAVERSLRAGCIQAAFPAKRFGEHPTALVDDVLKALGD